MIVNRSSVETAIDWVSHHALVQPDAVAIRNADNGESRTWAELEQRVGCLAHGFLNQLGMKAGDRVATIMDADIRSFELQFACMRAGLILVPMNFRLAAKEIRELCEETEPALLVSDNAWAEVAEEVAKGAGINNRLETAIGGNSPLDRLIESSAHMRAPEFIDPYTVTHIFFTSGTTGTPKGAMSTHSSLAWNAINQVQYSHVSDADANVYIVLPLFHSGGFNSLANPILYFGGQVTISPRFDPSTTASIIGNPDNGITHLGLPPIMYQMIHDAPEFAKADLSKLKVALIAGGKSSESLRLGYAAKGVNFQCNYGSTEGGPTIATLDADNIEMFKAGACGQAVKHVQLRLVDEKGNDVATGEQGEIWVRGPAITAGYWRRDPAVAFTEDGWFKTGDVAKQDEKGFLFLVDRIKDMYKSGAENVSSQEVESILLAHPAIAECAVIGVPDDKWGEVGLAVVCPAKDCDVTLETLEEACEGHLARYKFPKYVEQVENFPRNVTGKISKAELREKFKGSRTA